MPLKIELREKAVRAFVGITLRPDLVKVIDELADLTGRTRSNFIEFTLDNILLGDEAATRKLVKDLKANVAELSEKEEKPLEAR